MTPPLVCGDSCVLFVCTLSMTGKSTLYKRRGHFILSILHEHSKIDTLIYTNKSANILKWVNKSSDKQYHEGWDKTKTYASVVIGKKAYKVIRLYSPSPYALRSVSKEVRREQYDMVFKLE